MYIHLIILAAHTNGIGRIPNPIRPYPNPNPTQSPSQSHTPIPIPYPNPYPIRPYAHTPSHYFSNFIILGGIKCSTFEFSFFGNLGYTKFLVISAVQSLCNINSKKGKFKRRSLNSAQNYEVRKI